MKHYPDEEFWPIKIENYLNVDADAKTDTIHNLATYISYDILAACSRQKLFYYQVFFKHNLGNVRKYKCNIYGLLSIYFFV